jgi:hypothetical protein
MDSAALMGGVLEDPAQGGHEPGVLVGEHEPDADESAALEGAQEAPLERFVFRVADVQARTLVRRRR